MSGWDSTAVRLLRVKCQGWIREHDEQAGRKHRIDALEYCYMAHVAFLCVC